MPSNRVTAGVTVVEVLLAITVLTVGLLGLATAAALVTRMVAQGRRATEASLFAAQRLELLRTAACGHGADLHGGQETMMRGTVALVSNSWRFSRLGAQTWQIQLTTASQASGQRSRTVLTETAVIC